MSNQVNDEDKDFLPLNSSSPFNNLVGPYFVRFHHDSLIIGLRLEDKHCNNSGRLHGAMIAAIFDTALGHNLGLAIAKDNGEDLTQYSAGVPGAPILTTSLTTDYLGTAFSGDWVEVSVDIQRAGKSMAFANAELFHDGQRIAKASGIFRVFN